MLEIACTKCNNCSDEGCLKYGSDADNAVNLCADEGFKNYTGATTKFKGVKMACGKIGDVYYAVGKDI